MTGIAGLPRTQAGSQPQHLLVTLLGDYWFGRTEHIPSAALVNLLAEFGITTAGARVTLSRLTRRGLLVSSREGRRTFYGLSPRAREILAEGSDHIFRFAATDTDWDGHWTFVAFSVPEGRRHVRPILRSRLRWLGFAPLYDGLWVSPHPPQADLDRVIDELGIETSTIITGTTMPRPGAVEPISAWDLDGLRLEYDDFVEQFEPVRADAERNALDAAAGLVARTEIMDRWRQFPNLDPELPGALLPEGWPRKPARALFVDVYDALGPLAEQRVREIVSAEAPALGRFVHHHTTTSALDRRSMRGRG